MNGFVFLKDNSVCAVSTQDLPVKNAHRFVWNEGDLLQWSRELGPGGVPLLEGLLLKLGASVRSPSGKDERTLAHMVWAELNRREGKTMAKKSAAAVAVATTPVPPVKVQKAIPAKVVKAAPKAVAPEPAEEGEAKPKATRSTVNKTLIIHEVDGAEIPARVGSTRHQIMSELTEGRTLGEFLEAVSEFGGGKKDIEIAVEKGYITLEDPNE